MSKSEYAIINPPIILIIVSAPLNGLNINIKPSINVIIFTTSGLIYSFEFVFFSAITNCNLNALFTIIHTPNINGIMPAMTYGFDINTSPNTAINIPYTSSIS